MILCQLGPQLAPKTFPKWGQVGSKIDASWADDFQTLFDGGLGTKFIDFLLQQGMAEVAKIVDSCTCFILFAILVAGLLG